MKVIDGRAVKTTPEDIIGADAVEALLQAGFEVVPAQRAQKPTFDGFAEVWAAYPHKVAKVAAIRAYNAAIKRGHSHNVVLQHVVWYVHDKPIDRPWLNLSTFLNQERWNDEPAPVQQGGNGLGNAMMGAAAALMNGRNTDDGKGRIDDAPRGPVLRVPHWDEE